MNKRALRWTLVGLDAFAALCTVAGGVELVTGLKSFPASWLQGTPFSDYTVPGLILGIVVGGSATAATVMTVRSTGEGAVASLVAGLMLAGWIVGEVLLLNQPNPTPVEATFFGVGVLMAALAMWLAKPVGVDTKPPKFGRFMGGVDAKPPES